MIHTIDLPWRVVTRDEFKSFIESHRAHLDARYAPGTEQSVLEYIDRRVASWPDHVVARAMMNETGEWSTHYLKSDGVKP